MMVKLTTVQAKSAVRKYADRQKTIRQLAIEYDVTYEQMRKIMVKAGYSVSAGRDSQDSDYYLYAYTCYQDGKTGKAIERSNLAADLWYDTGGCGFCFYG